MFPAYFGHLFIQKYCRRSVVLQVYINSFMSSNIVVCTNFDLQKEDVIMPNRSTQLFKKLYLFTCGIVS